MNLRLLIPLALSILLAACDAFEEFPAPQGSGSPVAEGAPPAPLPTPPAEPADEQAEPLEFAGYAPAGERHSYFPLAAGSYWIYEGEDEGRARRDEVSVLEDVRIIAGTPCTGVEQRHFLDGELAELTTEWFAEDPAGNVWKFGEESLEMDDGELRLSRDSWMTGVRGAMPWMLLPAAPREGDRYSGPHPDGGDELLVLSLSAVASVPAGVFANCLLAVENPEEVDDADILLYGAGVGLVSESSPSGRIELIEYGRR
ncbi:MAG: hypothetical protein ACT4PV_00275 [Planctomycetaceae bacterium]